MRREVQAVKVSYQWLADYVDLTGNDGRELAEKLTRTGIEVDSVESRNQGVDGVVVGYVKTREKHPDADKLSVCTVDVGQEAELQIVCGAKNVAAGQKVPVAVIGAVLPGDFKIKKAKLRGVGSQGMICSAKELGLDDKLLPKEIQEGILVLPEDTQVGASILEVLGISDEVLDFDLTPNRSDCLSMHGAAYEVGAILSRPVDLSVGDVPLVESGVRAADKIGVKVEAEEQCPHYAARFLENVKIGPSPLWIQNRLMAAGIRPISNIVDITNYVMLEYGQPLHAFDADRLTGGQIVVRMAKQGEKLVTLDGVERELEPHMLLITDGVQPVAIAGVMGGANSEVKEDTTRILLESARFWGSSVRKTSRQLGLRSEASLRFEKEVDPGRVLTALNRAASLMAKYASASVAEGIVEAASQAVEPRSVGLSLVKVNNYLGTDLTLSQVTDVLDRLKFKYDAGAHETLTVHVPSRRGDITRDVDLIEEVARLYGYDHIPTTLMQGVTTPGSLTRSQKIRRSLRSHLAESGLLEVVNYSFVHPEQIAAYAGLYPQASTIPLATPMSEDRSALRTSLIPQLLELAAYNRNRNEEDIAIFEIGSVFIAEEERLTRQPDEKPHLAVLLTGKRQPQHWGGKAEPVDFYDLKGLFEHTAAHLGLAHVSYSKAQPEGYHPGRTAAVSIGNGQQEVFAGYVGQLHPSLQQKYDLKDTYIMEISLVPVYENADFAIEAKALPRYPSIGRDLAVVVDRALETGRILHAVEETAGELLESVQVFDIYTGERLGNDKKSVALALVYRHPDRTLTDEEVTERQAAVVQALEQSFGAELRK